MPVNNNLPKLNTRSIGNKGEDIACYFLVSKGFKILQRNFSRPWGELDIVAQKDNILHFIEVKSITNTKDYGGETYKPEENVHLWKVSHIRRMIETYFASFHHDADSSFQFHLICVYMDQKTRKARTKWIKNIIL